MRNLWDRTHPGICLVVVIGVIIATWFVSHNYTLATIEPSYEPDTNIIWVWDCYGNLNHYRNMEGQK